MDIEHILRTELQQEDREIVAEAKKRWANLGSGAHLREWMGLAPALRIQRKLAMHLNNTNQPKGRGYTRDYGELLRAMGINTKDGKLMTTLTAVLWIDDQPERITTLREIIDTMSPGERSRLNSPITARQRIEKILYARDAGKEDKLKVSPMAIIKAQLMEATREIADLKQDLASAKDGNACDFMKDTIDNIARTMIGATVGTQRAVKIAKRVLELAKDEPPTPKAKTATKKDTPKA